MRKQLEVLTELLLDEFSCVLSTLEEITTTSLTSCASVAVTVQHAFRESRERAFAGAGLTASVSGTGKKELRRAHSEGSSTAG